MDPHRAHDWRCPLSKGGGKTKAQIERDHKANELFLRNNEPIEWENVGKEAANAGFFDPKASKAPNGDAVAEKPAAEKSPAGADGEAVATKPTAEKSPDVDVEPVPTRAPIATIVKDLMGSKDFTDDYAKKKRSWPIAVGAVALVMCKELEREKSTGRVLVPSFGATSTDEPHTCS